MKRIEPINWKQIDIEMTGLTLEEAVKRVCEKLVSKVNELVDEHNRKRT